MVETLAGATRHGKGGTRLQPAALTVALFTHTDSRPSEHIDGVIFADMNLHVHAAVANLVACEDSKLRALHSTLLRRAKMAAGAAYHASHAHRLSQLGVQVEAVGKNGQFQISGIAPELITYFSGRRREIEQELAAAGVTSDAAPALAGLVARTTRSVKGKTTEEERRGDWKAAFARLSVRQADVVVDALVMRTGTSKTGKIYTYYTCANRMTKGSKACRGTNVSMPALDDLVLSGIEEHLLPPERLLKVLEALIARKRQFAANVDGRLETLNVERAKVESALKNIYKLVETGALGADDMLTARITELRDQKTKIEATIERALANAAPISEVTPEALRSFSQAVREKLLHGDIALRRNYLRSVVGQVIVEPQKVTIVGSTHALHAAVTRGEFSAPRVRSLVQKWRTRQDSNL